VQSWNWHRLARVPLFTFLALGMAFLVLPIAIVVIESFNSSPFGQWPPPGLSTRWYAKAFHDSGFGDPAVKSFLLAAGATLVALVVGTLVGLALARYFFWGRRFVEGYVLSPLVVPKVAFGFAAFILFFRLGWYGSFGSLLLVHVIVTLPFVVTLTVAGLARVDPMLEEAAADLGANPVLVLWRATLPQLRGAMVAAAAFSFIISFDELDASVFVVGQHANTLPVEMFVYMQKFQDPTLAAVSALMIGLSFVATIVIALLVRRLGGVRALSTSTSEPDGARAAP